MLVEIGQRSPHMDHFEFIKLALRHHREAPAERTHVGVAVRQAEGGRQTGVRGRRGRIQRVFRRLRLQGRVEIVSLCICSGRYGTGLLYNVT